MLRFGQVVPGSVKRGYIKGTDIENGARYLDILNCESVLPIRTSLGRFEVRLFADNNRTPCFHCKLTGHPSYQCKDRPKILNERRCYNCAAIGHLANDCPNEPYCSYCNIKGHPRRDCESFKHYQEKEEYGKYGPEIFEGRQENKSDAHSDCDNDTLFEDGRNDTANTVNILIGASNCTRLGETDKKVINASKSGANFENFPQSLDLAAQKSDSHKVDKVAICLGTNYILSKHKDDCDQINLLVTKAVAQVKAAYPESHVGLCSIIPRKGNSAQINRLNRSATNVNKFIRKLCAREDNVDFVDLEKLFYRNGTIIRSMFDKADNSGAHISIEGAQNIKENLAISFFLQNRAYRSYTHRRTLNVREATEQQHLPPRIE
ncbi:CNBP [Mytilus coruscus]|uniref:CNBP n=1 Tax=Mytilus coruscus TaxID=42192 RepID=A0A6J8DWI9_MYTCO|nr:CNBP [Mytilus coruscus]